MKGLLQRIDGQLGRLLPSSAPGIGDRIETSAGWGRRKGTVAFIHESGTVFVQMDDDGQEYAFDPREVLVTSKAKVAPEAPTAVDRPDR